MERTLVNILHSGDPDETWKITLFFWQGNLNQTLLTENLCEPNTSVLDIDWRRHAELPNSWINIWLTSSMVEYPHAMQRRRTGFHYRPWDALLKEMEIRCIRLDGENSKRKIKINQKLYLCALPAGEVPCIFRDCGVGHGRHRAVTSV
jgi:hypothetical protein